MKSRNAAVLAGIVGVGALTAVHLMESPTPATAPRPTTWPATDPPGEWDYLAIVIDNGARIDKFFDWCDTPERKALVLEALDNSGDGRELMQRFYRIGGDLYAAGCDPLLLRCACPLRVELRREGSITVPWTLDGEPLVDPRVGGQVEIVVVYNRPVTPVHQSMPVDGGADAIEQIWDRNEIRFRSSFARTATFKHTVKKGKRHVPILIHFQPCNADQDPAGRVNVADRIKVRDQVGQPVTLENWMCDVRPDGAINSADQIAVRNAMQGG